MGFRFQKRVKLLPGITLNLSKSGVSTSIGTTGARVTLGHGKMRTTAGLPGSGLSYTKVTSTRKLATQQHQESARNAGGMGFGALLGYGMVGLFVFMVVAGMFGWI